MHHGKQIGFHNLRFQHRPGDLQQGFFRKNQRPLRHRPHITLKAKLPQVVEEPGRDRVESRLPAQKVHILAREMEVLQVGERRIQPRRHQVRTLRGQMAHEELKGGAAINAVLEIRRRHCQLIQVHQ